MTPVPSRMRRVRSAAAAIRISGEATISAPPGVVLAEPNLIEAEPIEMLDEVELAANLQRSILAERHNWGDETAKSQSGAHEPLLLRSFWLFKPTAFALTIGSKCRAPLQAFLQYC